MKIDGKPIRVDDPTVTFCGRCGRPMAVCRANSVRCSAAPAPAAPEKKRVL